MFCLSCDKRYDRTPVKEVFCKGGKKKNEMKRLTILLIAVFLLSGCVLFEKKSASTIPKPSCPRENVIFSDGNLNLIWVPEGFFDGEPGPWGNFVTEEQYKKAVEEYIKKEEGL